ncbi:MAG: TIGR00266 family protein [Planctomycetota bacterium]|jgi:uncharacterized protein (TIGR00266 family)
MRIDLQSSGGFRSALVHLEAGESFVSESGAMYRTSDGVDIDVTTRSRGKGGVLRAAKRLLAGDSFFLSTYRAEQGPGEVGLAPTLPGDVRVIELDGSVDWITSGGSYLGSSPEVELETQFQGLKGLFTGESLFFLLARGTGSLLVSAFGRLEELEVEGEMVIDTGHLVAFESTLEYRVGKAAGSWLQSFLAGEGVVLHFSGRGRVWVQSHAANEFGKSLGPMLPERKN